MALALFQALQSCRHWFGWQVGPSRVPGVESCISKERSSRCYDNGAPHVSSQRDKWSDAPWQDASPSSRGSTGA